MKALLLLLFLTFTSLGFSQEFESDIYATPYTSSLHLFKDSDKRLMQVTTYRNSKQNGTVIETTSTYRKGKINPERINFNIKYTEYYAIEDRKKSLGKYEFKDGSIHKYERTDFDHNNARLYTLYSHFVRTNDIVNRENMRTKEYVASGSIDFDTVVYKDTVIYEVIEETGGYRQNNLSDPGVYAIYDVSDGQLKSKTLYFKGFNEKITYTYDSKGHLVKILNVLSGDDSGTITTRTELHYTMDGLLDEAKFYDEQDVLLERKVFTYK